MTNLEKIQAAILAAIVIASPDKFEANAVIQAGDVFKFLAPQVVELVKKEAQK